MLTEFFLKRKIASLVQRSWDDSRLDQYTSIAELGRLPPCDESIRCLIQHTRERHSATGREAVKALGMIHDRRVTEHLMSLLQDKDGWWDNDVASALAKPHHVGALPALAAMARPWCREYDEGWRLGRVIDLMLAIDPVQSQPLFEELVPLVLESAHRQLHEEPLDKARPAWAERFFDQCQRPKGMAARVELQESQLQHHRQVVMTSGRFGEIENSLEWLRKAATPAAERVVAEFLRTPSRRVVKAVCHDVSDDDSPAARYEWFDESCFTSELGQPPGLEEQGDQEETSHARSQYEKAEDVRRHRENVFPVLLSEGTPEDLQTYATLCLEQPVYDLFTKYFSWPPRDPGTPKLNRLVAMVRQAADKPRAAELLRLVRAGDRTKLWNCLREALGKDIDWKKEAAELLELTEYPTLDDLLASWIEGEWAAGKASVFTPFLARRDPVRLANLAAQHLLVGNSSDARLEARQYVTVSEKKAIRVARQLYQLGKWSTRRDALVILSSLDSDESNEELRRWVASESDNECLAEVETRKGTKFVKECKESAIGNSS